MSTTTKSKTGTRSMGGILSRFRAKSQSRSSHSTTASAIAEGSHHSVASSIDISSSVAQNLPPDLLVPIFQLAVVDAFKTLSSYRPDPYHAAFIRIRAMEIPNLISAQNSICSAMRTCRSWYQSGCFVLYSYPFVYSHDSIRSFSRTMRKCADLAGMIRRIVVLDATPSRIPEDRHYLPVDWPIAGVKDRREREHTREELIAALKCCTKLEDLVVTTCSEPDCNILPLDTGLIPNLTALALCSLTIHGSVITHNPNKYHFALSPELNLPFLEKLYLRNVYFPGQAELPTLPRLHTLHLSQCSSANHGRPMLIKLRPATIPSLKALELYENHTRVVFEKETMQQLERLDYIGSEESYITVLWGKLLTDSFGELRHISFGFSGPAEFAVIEKLPQHLQSLTVHVQFDYDAVRKEIRMGNPIILDPIHDFFLSDSDQESSVGHFLTDIYVNVEPGRTMQTDQEVRLAAPLRLRTLQKVCAERKINVHAKVQDYTSLISQRLGCSH